LKSPARLGAALAAGAAIALGAPAAPALANGFALTLSWQSEAVVGKPLTIRASGTIPPPGDIAIPYWFSLDAIPTTVTTTCPPESWQGQQVAVGNGGSIVVLAARETSDAAGNFAIPVTVTPSAPGRLLLCAYTDDGATYTLAAASGILDIASAPSSQPGGVDPPDQPTPPVGGSPDRPTPPVGGSRPPSPPSYAAQGIRSCRALLAGAQARSCSRSIVRKANARCRRLHTAHARTRCLRAVRRAVRRSS
jgi:hypothetical protein